MHELPSDSSEPSTSHSVIQNTQVVVNKALVAQVELLQSENKKLTKQLNAAIEKPQHFHIQHIKHSDDLIRFYTGFVSYFVYKLEDKPGVSIMADRGFTIKDMLGKLGIHLNLPPFMEGRKQLPAQEVQEGRSIAHLRIHVERAIGRINNSNWKTTDINDSYCRPDS